MHCPDLTAGVPVYTPGELDADPRPERQARTGIEGEQSAADPARRSQQSRPGNGEDAAGAARSVPELVDAAGRWGYQASTVVELARFFYKAPSLLRLDARQRAGLAERLLRARARETGDDTLRDLAARGLKQPDRDEAIAAADRWLAGRSTVS
jgi:hypothetical protein